MTFAEKLIALRAEAGLNRGEVARRAGLSPSTYNTYESGRRPRSNRDAYERLAKLYGCTVEYLMDDSIEIFVPAETAETSAEAPKEEVREESVNKRSKRKAAREADEPAPKAHIELQYSGRAVSVPALIAKAQELAGQEKVDLYIKPEENVVYYVCNGEQGSFYF